MIRINTNVKEGFIAREDLLLMASKMAGDWMDGANSSDLQQGNLPTHKKKGQTH